jgi:hypothetical protein
MNSSFIGKEVVVFHKQRTYTNDSFVISANKNCTFSFCFFSDNGIIKLKICSSSSYFIKQTSVFPKIRRCFRDGEYSHHR